MIYRKEVDGRSIKLKIQQEFKLNKYYLLYSKSTISVLISSYLWGNSVPCSCCNCICKPNFVSFSKVGQVIVAFEVSFEDGEGVLNGIVVG